MALAPVATSAWIAACAADVGDASKVSNPLSGSNDGSPSSSDTGAPPGFFDQTSPPSSGDGSTNSGDSTSPSSQDTGSPGETSAPVDSPVNPPDGGPVDTGPPPPPPTGCAADAGVIAMPATKNSGNFNELGAVCVTYIGNINGWQASNTVGRSVTVVGATTQTLATIPNENQPGLNAGADGYIYWNYSAGTENYTSMSVF
jgi:hypothetical protein